jgi:hypothetical protein
MKIIIGFFIFCLVLFTYLHFQFHLKTSNDLEMYEIDSASKDKLEEICDLRQPILFDFDETSKITQNSNIDYILSNYHAFEIKIRNVKENEPDSEIYMPLPLHAANKLFTEDKTATYFSENNQDFLQETGVIKNLQYNDEYIRPYMVSNCNYDIMIGSENVVTPFRYELNYRNYFLVTQGSVQIKLAPPQSIRYLYPINDYENFEFKSPVNPWSPQPQYTADFDKVKCLEFTLNEGKTIYIPAYWWYSIKFNKKSSISCFRYRTYMNNAAITPHIFMYALQIQNVKRNVVKKVSIDILNKDNKDINKNSVENINTNNNTDNNIHNTSDNNSISINNSINIADNIIPTQSNTNLLSNSILETSSEIITI